MKSGISVRPHTRARRQLFTPCEIKNGPTEVSSLGTTVGLKQDGTAFVVMDNFHDEDNAHGMLDQDWTGYTIFQNEKDPKDMPPRAGKAKP